MYEAPGSVRCSLPFLWLACSPKSAQWIKHILIHEAVVLGEAPPQYWGAGKAEASKFWNAWDAEEQRYTSDFP